MDAELLDAEVKARIPKDQKKKLEGMARERHLKTADIVREALREKIALTTATSRAGK